MKVLFCIGGFPLTYNIIWFSLVQIMYCTRRLKIFLCTLWNLPLVKKSCNNINNNRAQVSRLCYFLWLCINWPNFIVWLCLLREILRNICIVLHYQPGCDVKNLEINFIFLIKPLLLHAQDVKINWPIIFGSNFLELWVVRFLADFHILWDEKPIVNNKVWKCMKDYLLYAYHHYM